MQAGRAGGAHSSQATRHVEDLCTEPPGINSGRYPAGQMSPTTGRRAEGKRLAGLPSRAVANRLSTMASLTRAGSGRRPVPQPAKCGGLALGHDIDWAGDFHVSPPMEGRLPRRPSQPADPSSLTFSRHRDGQHRPLAGQFRQPAETTNPVPANHQTAKYANSANESESCLSLRSSRPWG